MNTITRRGICLLLAVCLTLAIPVAVRAATGLPDELYLAQEGRYTCTLASSTMLVRARMYLNGSSRWREVTESVLKPTAWIDGVGLKWDFTYTLGDEYVRVVNKDLDGVSISGLKAILDDHPEGIVLYCGYQPHAVLLTDYEGDVFYCADPAGGYSGERITLEDSWIGYYYGSQATILRNVTAYWYVSDHSGVIGEIPDCGCSERYAGEYRCTAGDSLNIRGGHGTVYDVVGSIPGGATVTVTKASGTGSSDWAHVIYDGVSGYVSMGYLKKLETPLVITRQPASVTVYERETATLAVEAAGDGLTYRWQRLNTDMWDDVTFEGADTATLPVPGSTENSGTYRCEITDEYGKTVYTDEATVTVNPVRELKITRQPENATALLGEMAVFSVEADGDELTYQWQYCVWGGSTWRDTTVSGNTTDTITMEATEGRNGCRYRCVITDRYGNTLISQPAELLVEQPEPDCGCSEAYAGTYICTVTYTLNIRSGHGTDYAVVGSIPSGAKVTVTKAGGLDSEDWAHVTYDGVSGHVSMAYLKKWEPTLQITKQPESVTVAKGEDTVVTVIAEGEGLTYQWYYKNATASTFSKAKSFTDSTFSQPMTASRNGRQIYCVITDKYGNMVTTDTVTLKMVPPATELKIITQPEDVTVAKGEDTVVTVIAEGEGLTYQWYYKNATASTFSKAKGFTDSTFSQPMTASRNGRQIYCVITDRYGNTVSTDIVTLKMAPPATELKIVTQPKDVTVAKGEDTVVTVIAEGEGLTYQWYYKNATASTFSKAKGFIDSTFSQPMTASRNGRQIYCVITDKYGNTVTTDTVTLKME